MVSRACIGTSDTKPLPISSSLRPSVPRQIHEVLTPQAIARASLPLSSRLHMCNFASATMAGSEGFGGEVYIPSFTHHPRCQCHIISKKIMVEAQATLTKSTHWRFRISEEHDGLSHEWLRVAKITYNLETCVISDLHRARPSCFILKIV
ncbi:hypothetical protein M413DRAFT_133224 [Hebeloma cylindrosporum]|uniref:Uncharacterized protein n=1 Tax=Hebeloma cylindrosporum TaxID=76867 RepID=A0A0C2XXK4_HEBCY|nr:hypothetical protein M413DRAFT_133224 [Hebeloma cylindrosporum h7]